MATRFEIILIEGDPARLRAAAEEALEEIHRIELLLSLYRSQSDIGRINASAGLEPVRVCSETFNLLLRAREISVQTDGAFDPTAGPLIRAWGFTTGQGIRPCPESLARAKMLCGWSQVEMDEPTYRVGLRSLGSSIDLGAIGKGYALDRAATLLQESGIGNALLHGGTSSLLGIGPGPTGTGWKVALPIPGTEVSSDTTFDLFNTSLSISATWGKYFQDGDSRAGHVLDPRTGNPIRGTQFSTVVGSEATLTDALSTALLVMGDSSLPSLRTHFPSYRILTVGSSLAASP